MFLYTDLNLNIDIACSGFSSCSQVSIHIQTCKNLFFGPRPFKFSMSMSNAEEDFSAHMAQTKSLELY